MAEFTWKDIKIEGYITLPPHRNNIYVLVCWYYSDFCEILPAVERMVPNGVMKPQWSALGNYENVSLLNLLTAAAVCMIRTPLENLLVVAIAIDNRKI